MRACACYCLGLGCLADDPQRGGGEGERGHREAYHGHMSLYHGSITLLLEIVGGTCEGVARRRREQQCWLCKLNYPLWLNDDGYCDMGLSG
jgi:hypothetical protein